MANYRPKPKENIRKLQKVEVLAGQAMPGLDAIRQLGLAQKHTDTGVQADRTDTATLGCTQTDGYKRSTKNRVLSHDAQPNCALRDNL